MISVQRMRSLVAFTAGLNSELQLRSTEKPILMWKYVYVTITVYMYK